MSKKLPPYSSAAQSFIERSTAQSRGWRVIGHNTQAVDEDPLYLYVHDVASSYTWMARLNVDGFLSAALHVRDNTQETRETVSAHLAVLIGDLAEQRALGPSSENLSVANEMIAGDLESGKPGLFQLAALHAGSSETVFEEGMLQPQGHFIVLRYLTEEGVLLRSMLLPPNVGGAIGVLDGTSLTDVLASIIQFDMKQIGPLEN